MASRKPRIGIIGSGAIGGFYGLMLARAGFDVHFLLRSEYDVVREQGLTLEHAVHGVLQMPVSAYACAADMPPCDWLLVGPSQPAISSSHRSSSRPPLPMPRWCCCRTAWAWKSS